MDCCSRGDWSPERRLGMNGQLGWEEEYEVGEE